jgi:hypothetical protein
MPPMEPPMHIATLLMPSESRMMRWSRTSSRTLTNGNSGPYMLPVSELTVNGEADPYGDPRTLAQNTKNLVVSNARLGPINGPHLNVRCQYILPCI